MDLISKEELKDYLEKNISFGGTEKKFRFYDMIDSLPSAFEGKTYGEVIKALFPNAVIVRDRSYETIRVMFSDDVWRSPYKGVSE